MIEMGELKFGELVLKNPVSTEHTIYGLVMVVTNPLYDDSHPLKNFFEIEGADIYTEQPIVIMNRNAVSVDDFVKIHAGMAHLVEAMGLTEDDDLEATIIDNVNRTIRYARYINGSNTTIFDIAKNGGSKFINEKDREDALAYALDDLSTIANLKEIEIKESEKKSKYKVSLRNHVLDRSAELYATPKAMSDMMSKP